MIKTHKTYFVTRSRLAWLHRIQDSVHTAQSADEAFPRAPYFDSDTGPEISERQNFSKFKFLTKFGIDHALKSNRYLSQKQPEIWK